MHLWSDNLYDNMAIAVFVFFCAALAVGSVVLLPLIVSGGWLLALLAVWLWQRRHFRIWRCLGVPYLPAAPFVGNVWNLLCGDCCFGDQFRELYESKEAAGRAFVGIHVLHNHALLLRDPALIKRILVEDFAQFSSRFETTDAIRDTMGSQNLFFTKYETWRETHKIFAPFFAVGKVRQMYGLLEKIGQNLEAHMEKILNGADSVELEVKQLCALFTTDIIATLAFGIEAKSLQNPEAEFRRINEEKRHDLIDIFLQLQRTETAENIIHRPDFFVAQAAFLILAGFDTSSSTITFALYELAKNPTIQHRLRAELRAALQSNHDHQLSYDTVTGLVYLRQVVEEVLRLYPPTAFLDRCCNDLSSWNCGSSSVFKLRAGTRSTYQYWEFIEMHRIFDWPNPEIFDPGRFSPEQRQQHHPMTYLPFGAGPRGCIGTLLGQLEIRVGLLHTLKHFQVELCERTLPEMRFDPKAFVLTAHNGTFLRFVRNSL